MIDSNKRVFGLDLLRCVAILLVLVSHTFHLRSGSSGYYQFIHLLGFFGVEIFFVLSGFLIGNILIKIYEKEKIVTLISIRSFWVRRWFRTLPNYFLVLFIYEILYYKSTQGLIFSIDRNFSYFFFLQNFFNPMPDKIFQVSWSLCVEEWFYILFPLAMFAINYLKVNMKRTIFLASLLFISLPLLIRFVFSLVADHLPMDDGFRKMVPFRLDAIAYGVLLAYCAKFHHDYLDKHKKLLFFVGSIGVIFCFWGKYNATFPIWAERTIIISIVNLGFMLTIPLIREIQFKSRYIVAPITHISLISYSIYLIHFIILTFIPIALKKFEINISNNILILMIWVLTLIISSFQYEFFERKMTALREKFK